MAEAAIDQLMLVWERLSTFAAEIGIPADRLGVNVGIPELAEPKNVRAAFELADEFGRLLGVPVGEGDRRNAWRMNPRLHYKAGLRRLGQPWSRPVGGIRP